jgi:hypothetical protein
MGSKTAKQVLSLLVLIACGALLVGPTGVGAQSSQEGPQFRNWGPGMQPPDQEGVDYATPSSGAAGGSAEATAPYGGYAAPAPGVAPVPPYYSGCQHDMRGTWWNDGRQTSPGYRTYSAYVQVRQYRSWIHAQQDDGTSYYGQCIGSRILFDVYNAYQYVGRQSGNVSGYYRPIPYPAHLYDDSPAYSMPPAVTVPSGGSTMRASFTWSSFYGSGAETWQLANGGIPIAVPPIVVLPVAQPTPVPTPTRVPAATPVPPPPTPAVQSLRIDALQPARGPYGMEVVVTGSGFAPDNNLVTFGASSGLSRPDGSPANLIARVGSTDGRTVRFMVPRNGPSGILCDASGSCIGVSAALLEPGVYEVAVSNANGTSNVVTFEITPEG